MAGIRVLTILIWICTVTIIKKRWDYTMKMCQRKNIHSIHYRNHSNQLGQHLIIFHNLNLVQMIQHHHRHLRHQSHWIQVTNHCQVVITAIWSMYFNNFSTNILYERRWKKTSRKNSIAFYVQLNFIHLNSCKSILAIKFKSHTNALFAVKHFRI